MSFKNLSALFPALLLPAILVMGCIAEGDDASNPEENVAVTEAALTASPDIGQFFQNRQNKPPLSWDRGAGTIPNVCPAGYELILGGCWSWTDVRGASCPSGKEMDAGLCYNPCPVGYDGAGPVCWLGSIDAAVCDALYSPVLASSARNANRARTYGIGVGIAAGASVSVETGVYYGENGQYGCYTSVCSGAVTDVSIEMSASFGDFTSVAVLTGDGFDLSVGVGYGVAGYTQSLSFDGNNNVVGFVQQASLGVGLSPIAIGVSSCDTSLLQRSGSTSLSFQTATGHYLVAEHGGGAHVAADRTAIGPWERFRFIDLNGGQLLTGDLIALRASNSQIMVAEGGGGGVVNANRSWFGAWETFRIHNLDGWLDFLTGDHVALQAANGQYVVAEGGGGGVVNANRSAIGAWETFVLTLQ